MSEDERDGRGGPPRPKRDPGSSPGAERPAPRPRTKTMPFGGAAPDMPRPRSPTMPFGRKPLVTPSAPKVTSPLVRPPPPSSLLSKDEESGTHPANAGLTRSYRPSLVDVEPTVLIVGSGFPLEAELVAALGRVGVYPESAPADGAVESVVAAAPAMIVLAGDGAGGPTDEVLDRLHASPLTSPVPIVVLSADASLGARSRAFRRGARAVVAATKPPDEIAKEIARLAVDLPLGKLEPEPVEEIPVEKVVQAFEPLPPAEPALAPPARAPFPSAAATADVTGLRLVVVDDDSARADAVAHALRSQGASVLVSNLDPSEARMRPLRRLDPEVLIVGEHDAEGAAQSLIQRAREDHRLRWATVVPVRWEEVWPFPDRVPAVDSLLGTIAALAEPEASTLGRAEAGIALDSRLESIGPARLLRALAKSSKPIRVKVKNQRIRIELVLIGGELASIVARPASEGADEIEGHAALAALLVLRSGRVQVEPYDGAKTLRSLGPIEQALDAPETAGAPIAPSLFPEALGVVVPHSLPAASPPRPIPAEPEQIDLAPSEPAMPWFRRPVVIAAAAGIFALVVIAVGVVALVSRQPSMPTAGSSAVGSPSASAAPGASAAPTSLVARAQDGDRDALEKIEAIPARERTAEQAFALRTGRARAKLRELETLGSELQQKPESLADAQARKRMLEFARDPATDTAALKLIAGISNPTAADLLYEAWVGTRERGPTTELAESLVNSDAVRKQASPALLAALDLRKLSGCDGASELLKRATEKGDRRSLRPLARLTFRTGCGDDKASDCFPCLRTNNELADAFQAVRSRPAPKF